MKTAFSFEIRVITCGGCGAPLAVGAAGGGQACAHCGRTEHTQAFTRAIPRAAPMPEAARLAQLRAQDRHAVGAPPSLAHLFAGLDLLPWKVGEALALWKALRAEPAGRRSELDEQRLYRLTLGLAEHFADEGDAMRERSLLEAALETAERPRFRQALCGALARSACRAGDPHAAEAWLSLCDPSSDVLMSDTAYRFARATLDTAAGNLDRVLAVLGPNADAVPIDDEHEAACAVLRANAWERQGRQDHAVAVLDQFFRTASAYQRYCCARFVADHQAWGLAPASFAIAEGRQRERGAERSVRAAGAARFAYVATLFSFGVGAAVGVVLALFEVFGGAHFSIGLGGLLGMVFLVIGVIDHRKAIRARSLRTSGIAAPGRVVHARETGVVTMGVPQLLYRILVLPPRGAPFFGHAMFHADGADQARFLPGTLVVVRMDGQRSGDIQLELD